MLFSYLEAMTVTFRLPQSQSYMESEKHFRHFVFSVHVFLQFPFVIMKATVHHHMSMHLTFVRDGCLAVRFLIVSSSEH